MTGASAAWVLLRKGLPPQHFERRELAQQFYDRLRHNASRARGAVVYGPNGEGWYVAAGRHSRWFRDDLRRLRDEPQDAEQGGGTAA